MVTPVPGGVGPMTIAAFLNLIWMPFLAAIRALLDLNPVGSLFPGSLKSRLSSASDSPVETLQSV